jgi:hypothetical protein
VGCQHEGDRFPNAAAGTDHDGVWNQARPGPWAQASTVREYPGALPSLHLPHIVPLEGRRAVNIAQAPAVGNRTPGLHSPVRLQLQSRRWDNGIIGHLTEGVTKARPPHDETVRRESRPRKSD